MRLSLTVFDNFLIIFSINLYIFLQKFTFFVRKKQLSYAQKIGASHLGKNREFCHPTRGFTINN